MLKFTLILIFAFLSTSIHAKVDEESLSRFVKAVGIYEQIEAQRTALESQTATAGQQYIEQLTASHPNLPDSAAGEMKAAFLRMQSDIDSLIDAEVFAGVYANLISAELTNDEILEITRFYESKLGKKFTAANTHVMGLWASQISIEIQGRISVQMGIYIKEIQNIWAKYESQR